jgi:two-component system copper resistance phosphate regulon response regulator CusR
MESFRTEGADVVLMDLLVPDKNGLDAARNMLKVHLGVKIIAMTAMVDVEIEKKCSDIGCIDLLRKPFSTADLLEAVKRHIQPRPGPL